MSFPNPVDDVIALINEFGTTVTLRTITSAYDAQTGDPINSAVTSSIKVIPFSIDKMERIMNPTTLTSDTINFTTQSQDNVKINDEIVLGTTTYIMKEITEKPIFSYVPDNVNNSPALVTFRAIKKQASA